MALKTFRKLISNYFAAGASAAGASAAGAAVVSAATAVVSATTAVVSTAGATSSAGASAFLQETVAKTATNAKLKSTFLIYCLLYFF